MAGGERTDVATAGRPEATLIYNAHAGSGAGPDAEELVSLLDDAGFEARYRPTESAADLDQIFKDDAGLVVVAGGDGTIREVAKRLVNKPRPLAIIPLGTANNTARSLGIDGNVAQLIAGLRSPRRQRLDVARARGPWGDEFMLEGAGLGLFANVLAAYNPEAGKSLMRAVAAAANNLGDAPVRCRIELDGERLDGDFLMVEILNMQAVGPRLALAPEADPGDGLLDLVLVRHENRDAWLAYLRGLVTKGLRKLPSVEVLRGRELKINWRGSAFHVDAQPYCEGGLGSDTKRFSAKIELVPGAIELWLPGTETG